MGYYWELPNGEKQNRCPRVHIKEDPEWWMDIILTYQAYEKGFLPSAGGIDAQTYLLVPLMATISSAINDEEEMERVLASKRKGMVENSRNKGSKPAPRNAKMPIPPKKG